MLKTGLKKQKWLYLELKKSGNFSDHEERLQPRNHSFDFAHDGHA